MSATDKRIDPNDVAVLSANDQEYLLRAIEFALPIRKRSEFFVWAQAYLQSLIAHELFLCVCGDVRRNDFTVLKISGFACSDELFAEITDTASGLITRAIDAWHKGGEEPLAIYPGMKNAMQYDSIRTSLERHKLGNLVIHGAPGIDGAAGMYFVLAGMPRAFGAHQAHLFRLIMPHLRLAMERTLALERHQQTAESSPKNAAIKRLTRREIQILEWVREGKNNREIGVLLKISPFTVKNHLQHILKKLKAQTRAQALSRAISLKLLK